MCERKLVLQWRVQYFYCEKSPNKICGQVTSVLCTVSAKKGFSTYLWGSPMSLVPQ